MKRALIALGVFFGLLLVANTVQAAKPAGADLYHPEPIAELWKNAIKHGGFEMECNEWQPCDMPGVLFAEYEDENVAGYFHPRSPNYIVVNVKNRVPGSLLANATIVHEFVHYLQWFTGKLGPHTSCSESLEIEKPAYEAAAKYLAEFGIVEEFKDQLFSVATFAAMCQMGPH